MAEVIEYSHLIALIAAFLSAQIAAFLIAYKWVAAVRSLVASIKSHPIEPPYRAVAIAKLPWLIEVEERVGERGLSSATRAESLVQLESSFGDKWSFAILHRAAVLAPLLGVLITSMEFLRIGLRGSGGESLDIVTMILPLILGVGAGALLAAINQVLLMLLEHATASLLAAIHRWLRRFEHLGENIERATRVELVELKEVIHRHEIAIRQNAEAITSSSRALTDVSQQLVSYGSSLSESVSRVPQALHAIAEASEKNVTKLGNAIDKACEFGERLDGAVIRFENCVVDQFLPAAQRQELVSRGVNGFLNDVERLTAALAGAAGDLSKSIRQQRDLSAAMSDFFANDAKGHAEQLAIMERHVDDCIRSVTDFTAQLSGAVELVARQIAAGGATLTQLDQAAFNIANAIDNDLRQSLVAHRDMAESVSATTKNASIAVAELSRTIPNLRESVEIQRESIEQFRDSVHGLTVPTHQSLARAARELDVGTTDLSESIARFREFLLLMAGEVKRLLPVCDQTMQTLSPAALALRQAVEEQLRPALEAQEELITRQSEAISGLTAHLQTFASYSASLDQGISARQHSDREVNEAARSLNHAAIQLKRVIGSRTDPGQYNFTDAVLGLQGAITGLQQILSSGSRTLDEEIRNLNTVVQSVTSLLAGLKSISDMTASHDTPARFADLLESLRETVELLPKKLSDAVAMTGVKNQNKSRGLFSWFRPSRKN